MKHTALDPSRACHLDELNAEQRRAATHSIGPGGNVRGPLLVIAGAGSGKTKTIVHRAVQAPATSAMRSAEPSPTLRSTRAPPPTS